MLAGGKLTKAQRLPMEEFQDAPGRPDAFWKDVLADIKTPTDANAYTRERLHACSDEAFEKLARLYYGSGRKTAGGAAKKGRANEGEDRLHERLHPNVERLMSALDSFHDFGPEVLDILDVEVPKRFPVDWKDDASVLNFLGASEHFRFGSKKKKEATLPNPMFRAYLWKSFHYPIDEPDVARLAARHEHSVRNRMTLPNRLMSVDLPFLSNPNSKEPKHMRFESIVLMARTIREWFGVASIFLIDGTDAASTQLVTGILEIHNALHLDFITSSKWPVIRKKFKELFVAEGTSWERVVADANVFDPPLLAPFANFDERPTGRINANLALWGGSEGAIQVDVAGVRSTLTKDECADYSSHRATRIALKAFKQNKKSLDMDAAQWLDFKRGGDRGQVLHALRYNQILVTYDRFMAMYAYAVGAKFIYIRRTRPALYREHPYRRVYTWMLGRP